MAEELPTLVDGTTQFYGGQDASRTPYMIDKDQVAKLINCRLTSVGDNVKWRPAFHCQKIVWNSDKEREVFETGHVQGGDWYNDGSQNLVIVGVSGYLFEFSRYNGGSLWGRILNFADRNREDRTKIWTCRIPGNRLLVSDGFKVPFVLSYKEIRRTRPDKNEIGVCRMMVYIQNRLFAVGEFGREIFASDFANALSMKEAIATRIFGWPSPNGEQITAIGAQRYANIDENGGELVFSQQNNVYSVDVRGDRQDWGTPENGTTGFTRLVIPNFGACSQYSFTNFNANIYFRTVSKGIFGFKQVLNQFNNDDETVSGSVEVNNWLDYDTPFMLDQCWSVNYKGRLLTTTQPFTRNGYVCWNGVVSMNPAPLYSTRQKLPRRFEGLWTGVRPWCLIKQDTIDEKLFIVSLDEDGKNRLYKVEDDSLFDVDAKGKQRPIEWVIETRSFSFSSPETRKVMKNRYYTLDKVETEIRIAFYSRSTQKGQWTLFKEKKHVLPKCKRKKCLPFNFIVSEARQNQFLPNEKEDQCSAPFETSGLGFNYRQYRLEGEGACELSSFVCFAQNEPLAVVLKYDEEEGYEQENIQCPRKDFTYFVTKDLLKLPKETLKKETTSAKRTSSTVRNCGCKG